MSQASKQYLLDLEQKPVMDRGSFLRAPCNQEAAAMLDARALWPDKRLLITGPAGAGKTHLAKIYAQENNAVVLSASDLCLMPRLDLSGPVVVEDIHTIMGDASQEEMLFHLYNWQHSAQAPLLMTARGTPRDWPIRLKDLTSRLSSVLRVELMEIDDTLLSAILVKLFADRQIHVAPDLISFLVKRIERSFSAAQETVARLDRHALSQKRELTRSLASDVLRLNESKSHG